MKKTEQITTGKMSGLLEGLMVLGILFCLATGGALIGSSCLTHPTNIARIIEGLVVALAAGTIALFLPKTNESQSN